MAAAIKGSAAADVWLGNRIQEKLVRAAIFKAAPGDGMSSAAETLMQRCVRAATATSSSEGNAAYGSFVHHRIRESLRSPALDAAFEWAREAAGNDSSYAMLHLAHMLQCEIGRAQDQQTASDHIQAAAKKQSIIVQHILDLQ